MGGSDLKQSAHARIRPALARPRLFALALAFILTACADEPTTPKTDGGEGGSRTPPRAIGLVEITISGLGMGHVSSSALSASSVAELERLRAQRGMASGDGLVAQDFTLPVGTGGGDGTIQLELVSTGSFTEGTHGNGGYRYLYATYRVRNAQADGTPYDTPRKNLTFYAVRTPTTKGQTAISGLRRFDGSPADQALAAQFIPTGAVHRDQATGEMASTTPDVLQVVTEAEADAIEAQAGEDVEDVFPYGFVVRRLGSTVTRELPASPDEDQFDGIVTFAFKVPLQSSPADDPFTVSVMFLAVDDDEVKITQSMEEQTSAAAAAFEARATALGASVHTLLAPDGVFGSIAPAMARMLCGVRVAGAAGPEATTIAQPPGTWPWLRTPSLAAGFQTLSPTKRFEAASCSSMSTVDRTTFAVHGFQSGRNVVDAYEGTGSWLVRAPVARGGTFFPGEEVEVTLTTGLGGPRYTVARYRVAAAGGSGTFPSKTLAFGIDSNVSGVAVGDLNSDGRLDIVAANEDSSTVSVVLNPSGDTFGPSVPFTRYTTGAAPNSVALGDLDGDGDLDMVTADFDGHTVSVFFNQGDGTFESPTTYQETNPALVALGDLDGDGNLDMVIARSSQTSVRLNQGDGTFGPRTTYSSDNRAWSVALGDLDGDGDLDMVVGNYGSSSIWVRLNNGDGSFGAQTSYSVGNYPRHLALGDLDGDGNLDMVVAHGFNANYVTVLPGGGDGTFGDATTYTAAIWPKTVALGDLDGDGDLDLVVGPSAGQFAVLINNGNGQFSQAVTYPTYGSQANAVALGDMDGDGDLDVVVASPVPNGVFGVRNLHVFWNQ